MRQWTGLKSGSICDLQGRSSSLSSSSWTNGEDGSIQGFLEVLKMPYVGCGILASSVAMDKITTKRVIESAGIPQVPYVAVVEGDDVDERKLLQLKPHSLILSLLNHPIWVLA